MDEDHLPAAFRYIALNLGEGGAGDDFAAFVAADEARWSDLWIAWRGSPEKIKQGTRIMIGTDYK